MKLYKSSSSFDFGKYKNQNIELILKENNEYLNWCFQKIDTFCMTDELFNKLNFIIELKKGISRKDFADQLKKMEALHKAKKKEYESFHLSNRDNRVGSDYNYEYERPSLDDLIAGDEQMQDWYNSNERN
jgi:hypothetical protein